MSEDLTGEIKNTPSLDVNAEPSTAPEVEATQEAKANATETPDEPKKANKVQERINKLTREKHEQRQENADLKKRLEALESKPAEVKDELVAPKEDSFDSYSDYERANTDYIANKAANAAVKSVEMHKQKKAQGRQG